MEVNNSSENKDGGPTQTISTGAPPIGECVKDKISSGNNKRKRRRGKTKRKMVKPFLKLPWQDRRRNDKVKKNNRFRKVVVNKTRAPYNNNQFLMEIHKPEPENNFPMREIPSTRTRDSSFSIDSDENYFYSLPEDEEDFLTKEFSSVYEDAQSERLSNMSKNELIQEYLILESKYENLIKTVKRSDRSKIKCADEDNFNRDTSVTDKDTSVTDKDSEGSDKDTTATSGDLSMIELPMVQEMSRKMKEQEEQIRDLKLTNDKLRLENEHLRHQRCSSSSADSMSDSSSTSFSCSSNSQCGSPVASAPSEMIEDPPIFDSVGVTNSSEQMNGEHLLMNETDQNGLSQSPSM